jgi:Fur family peroxide stress response transcriptional regulator
MSLATVYKTLRTLIEIGLVQEINVGEDNFRYDAKVDTHPHLICKSCSRVDDIENHNFSHINDEAQKITNYKIDDSKLFFYGICPECQKEGR